ncbi:MAG: multidrug transporter subunit MdtD [Desulfobulbaceae bacterium]|jgi:EmrB/QacA subfamily drug resistance transporter|nr:multidrug transporter subunit MdtD [Desulfobulbaceae bacterium]
MLKNTSSTVLSPRGARIVPWLVAVAFFMQMLDTTILNTALPGMARVFGVSAFKMHSVIISYMLMTAMLIPASGWLADRWGTRRAFCLGIAFFTLGSALCAIAKTLEFLVFARAVQGIGGALMTPIGRLIILKAYPRAEFVRLLSFVTLPGLIGPLLGPVTGGFFVEYASWHWIFIINLPVGALGLVFCLLFIPEMVNKETGRFDVTGFLLFAASMVLISMAMEGFGQLHLPGGEATLLAAAGLLFMCVYWLRGGDGKQMLFSPRLFATRSFSIGITGNLFARLAAGAVPFLNPLFLQLGLGFSPLQSGLFTIPVALGALVSREIIPNLVDKLGFRALLTGNTILLGGVISSFSLITTKTPTIIQILLLACVGTINSTQFMTMNSFTLIELPQNDAASGNSLLAVTQQISMSMGVTIAATLLSGFTTHYSGINVGTEPAGGETVLKIFHATFLVIGLLALVSACIFHQANPELGKKPHSQRAASALSPQESGNRQQTGSHRTLLAPALILAAIAACCFALYQLDILILKHH